MQTPEGCLTLISFITFNNLTNRILVFAIFTELKNLVVSLSKKILHF